jgi:GT2 family glycosyltransferase
MNDSDQIHPVSVVLATRNRRSELERALRSCLLQEPAVEVIVVDDGSTDGTAEVVRARFPSVRLQRSEVSRGYIYQRNRGVELARGEWIVSLDDDAEFSSPTVVAEAVREFGPPRVGAVTIPWRNVPEHRHLSDKAPDAHGIYCTRSYTGLAHVIRRDIFLSLGGYRECLVHGSEELDLGVRMLNRGWVIRLGSAPPVFHHESKIRNVRRQARFAARNAVLFCLQHAPARRLPLHLTGTVLGTVIYGCRQGHLAERIRGLCAGFAGGIQRLGEREALRPEVYQIYRRMTAAGMLDLAAIEEILPPVLTGLVARAPQG